MNMDIAIGLAIGILIGGTVAGVFLGNLAHQHYEAFKAQQAINFGLEQTLIHELEGQVYPKYVLSTDGVDPVIERNRPDIDSIHPHKAKNPVYPPTNAAPDAGDDITVLDLTGVEDA